LDQNWQGVWTRGASEKSWDPLRIFATIEASNFKFGTQIGFGTSLPKNNVKDQNWRGMGQRSIRKKIGTPYLFLQPIKKIGTQQAYLAKHKF